MEIIEKLHSIACLTIDNNSEKLYDLSQDIWKHPELNYEEVFAHQTLCKFLQNQGFAVTPSYKIATAFKAEYGNDGGANIAVLCEYDALPEIGHACGHNLIAEVGVAAGMAIKAAIEDAADKGNKLGKVTVIGTPAEEGGGGKVKMIDAGAFDGVDVAMMAHPSYVTLSRPLFLALRTLRVEFHGKAAHAASCPWEGLNSLDAAVVAYQSIACLRQHIKPEHRINVVISKGGTKPNIIPDFSEMQFYIRCLSTTELDVLYKKVVTCCEAAATATGCTMKHFEEELPYNNLISNDTLSTRFEHHSANLDLVRETDPEKTRQPGGSTDMGNLSHHLPGLHPKFFIGAIPLHSRPFADVAGSREAQTNTLKVAKTLALIALDLLCDPRLLDQAKADFARDMAAAKGQ